MSWLLTRTQGQSETSSTVTGNEPQGRNPQLVSEALLITSTEQEACNIM